MQPTAPTKGDPMSEPATASPKTGQDRTTAWLLAFVALGLVYTGIYFLYADKFFQGSNFNWYDCSAEVIRRILFGGDIRGLSAYTASHFGFGYDYLGQGWSLAVSAERPLYFLFLVLLKSVSGAPLALHYFLSAAMLLTSVFLLAKALSPSRPILFFLLAGLFLPPYLTQRATLYEAHILEVFLTCLSLFLYTRGRVFGCFFLLTLSVFAHPGNMALAGCFGLYHLTANWRRPTAVLPAVAGGLVAWGLMEAYQQVLIWRDVHHLLPHETLLYEFLFKSGRTRGQFAQSSGALSFWKNSLVFLPIATVGLFWVRSRLQFALTLLPVLLYAGVTVLAMPGENRVLLPIYFLGYAYFWHHFLGLRRWPARIALAPVILYAGVMIVSYHVYLAGCLPLDRGATVAVATPGPDAPPFPATAYSDLYFLLAQHNTLAPTAAITYELEGITRRQSSNVAEPVTFYGNFLYRLLAAALPASVVNAAITPNPYPPEFRLRRQVGPPPPGAAQ